MCGLSEAGEDGWSAVGGKRGKPQRNKRPSGLIRRQIGCRVQWRERERERYNVEGRRESLAFWEDLMSPALIFQPACTRIYNRQLFKACTAPATSVHAVMDELPSRSSCIFMLSRRP